MNSYGDGAEVRPRRTIVPAGLAQRLGEIARRVDHAGCDSLSVMDHFFQIEFVGPAESDMLEAYTTLGFLAGITRQVKLGALVTGVTYRHPGVLAKMVASLDVLSQGRAWLGIGAAWYEREHVGRVGPSASRKARNRRPRCPSAGPHSWPLPVRGSYTPRFRESLPLAWRQH